MNLEISYAEMSFIRELVHKYRYERWRKELKRMGKDIDILTSDDIEDVRQQFWENHDRNPPLTDEDCAVLLFIKCEKLELDCKVALGLEQPAKKAEKVIVY
jgi:hypothetical protein